MNNGIYRLYRSVETASLFTDQVLVSFSGGKDSVVTLDLCIKHFKKVMAFFMFHVEGLSFQEAIIRYYEDKYGIPILRVPNFKLSEWLRYGLFRPYDYSVPIISVKDIYSYMREMTGIFWIAGGERINDSLWRRAMIKCVGSIDTQAGCFYPIAEWTKNEVFAYIKQHKLKIGPESRLLGRSFGNFGGKYLIKIKKHYPADYQKIKSWFPLVDVSIMNMELRNGKEKQVPEV